MKRRTTKKRLHRAEVKLAAVVQDALRLNYELYSVLPRGILSALDVAVTSVFSHRIRLQHPCLYEDLWFDGLYHPHVTVTMPDTLHVEAQLYSGPSSDFSAALTPNRFEGMIKLIRTGRRRAAYTINYGGERTRRIWHLPHSRLAYFFSFGDTPDAIRIKKRQIRQHEFSGVPAFCLAPKHEARYTGRLHCV